MQYRIVLPLLSVALAVMLLRVGDRQRQKIVDLGHHEEMVPHTYARARYLDYAINAPVWAIVEGQRDQLWPYSSPKNRDLGYILGVIVMWYLLGFQLDKKFVVTEARGRQPKRLWQRILGLACVCYGLFLYDLMTPEFVSLRGYGNWLPLRHYELWFIAAVLAWGVGMVLVGAYWLFRRSGSAP
jgi:hypothetical protein